MVTYLRLCVRTVSPSSFIWAAAESCRVRDGECGVGSVLLAREAEVKSRSGRHRTSAVHQSTPFRLGKSLRIPRALLPQPPKRRRAVAKRASSYRSLPPRRLPHDRRGGAHRTQGTPRPGLLRTYA
jgi:hypothetical protein